MNSSRHATVNVPNCPQPSGPQLGLEAAWKSAVKSRVRNVRNSRNIPSMKPKSPMRLTMNAFFPASDDDFPANKEKYVVCREHQNQHEEHKQIEIREEAVVAAFMRHISGRINVDEPAD